MRKKRKADFTTVILILVLLAGLSLLLYPTVANFWNSMHATRAIASYAEQVANMDDSEFEQMYLDAVEYNQSLNKRSNSFVLDEEQQAEYESLLNISGSGVMGYIDIESLDVSLPIYHGTSEGVLQVAVGHLDWTSLPVGGTSTHCVLSGHRGLPSAKLFTDLDQLREGDVFMLNILNETLTYEIDQIRIVLPQETEELIIKEGKDYCTLITCTPYGINTHRLLVRGHRIETAKAAAHVVSEAVRIDPLITGTVASIPILLLLLIGVFLPGKKRRRRRL